MYKLRTCILFQLNPSKFKYTRIGNVVKKETHSMTSVLSEFVEIACNSYEKCSVDKSEQFICAVDIVKGKNRKFEDKCALLKYNCHKKGNKCKL